MVILIFDSYGKCPQITQKPFRLMKMFSIAVRVGTAVVSPYVSPYYSNSCRTRSRRSWFGTRIILNTDGWHRIFFLRFFLTKDGPKTDQESHVRYASSVELASGYWRIAESYLLALLSVDYILVEPRKIQSCNKHNTNI